MDGCARSNAKDAKEKNAKRKDFANVDGCAFDIVRHVCDSFCYNPEIMSAVDMKRRFPHILALILLLVIGWSAWRPAEWGVWWMEITL